MAEDASNPKGHSRTADEPPPPPPQAGVSPPTRDEGYPPSKSSITPAAKQATPTAASTKPVDSQPMTAAATIPASSTAKEPSVSNATAEGVSPYGTRSRQRGGQARPNYAEADAGEPDLDFEIPVKKTKHHSSSPNSGLHRSAVDEYRGPSSTRRSSTTTTTVPNAASKGTSGPSSHHTTSASVAGLIPGTSSFSVHPDSTGVPVVPSRKRKQPGGATVGSHVSTASASSSATGSSRRQGVAVPSQSKRTTNLMSFEKTNTCLKNGKLKADDGTTLGKDDQFYAVSEPPGDCYYLGRLQSFVHEDGDPTKPVESLKANWFIRPTEVGRKVNDTRLVFASFNSALCPVTSLRGKCSVIHRSEISDLEVYRKQKDCFYFERLFDRYIHRYYDIIPSSKINNVPARVKKVLDERWKFIVVEVGRGRDLTSAIKSCKRCADFSSRDDSVDCSLCKNTYHMSCVRPPLLKKPARGFGWSCGPCSRKQERKLEARNTPNQNGDDGEEENVEQEEEDPDAQSLRAKADLDGDDAYVPAEPTAEQKEAWETWPYRYLGIHCRVEDALDNDDRIYPRASSRLGPKHQAIVQTWPGRPVRYVKAAEVKRKYMKQYNFKKEIKVTKEPTTALEAERMARDQRPKWILDEPPGYQDRGEDHPNNNTKNTARAIFRLPPPDGGSSRGFDASHEGTHPDERERMIDEYMSKARGLARVVGVQPHSTNFLDKALELLVTNEYHSERALEQLQHVKRRKDLKEPELNREELKRFEEGVAKWGSGLQNISRHVGKGQKYGDIVRFYYMWKKTKNGREIWGSFDGRKAKKQAKNNQSDPKLLDDVADDDDDSAFDNAKAAVRRRGFECKFCQTRQSPQWHRAPNVQPGTTVPADPDAKSVKDKSNQLMLALCQRCTSLWRKYAIAWENIDEVAKKVQSTGGKAWKRKQDQELLSELLSANEASQMSLSTPAAAAASSIGIDVPPAQTHQPGQDGSKKKQRLGMEQSSMLEPANGVLMEPVKKKPVEKVEEPPIVPDPPRIRLLPCAVCYEFEPLSQHLCCSRCRLTVHRDCYGVPASKATENWICDMCTNDAINTVSTTYECILCTVNSNTDTDVALLMEPPRVSHKKKSDREREKERLEKEMIDEKANDYFREQEQKGRPKTPRQPLKRTAGNNWVHIVCAVFHPEIKYSNPELLEFAENVGDIPVARWSQKCKHCKANHGACINCQQCQAAVHVGCAQQFGYHLVFDLSPVKQSRKDAVNTVGMGGEFGSAAAVIYCREHGPKQTVHRLCELDEGSSMNALQKYVRSHKQADTSMTGTTRKALMMQNATKTASQLAGPHQARGVAATTASVNGSGAGSAANRSSCVSPAAVVVQSEETDETGDRVVHLSDVAAPDTVVSKRCHNCDIHASPRWHKLDSKQAPQNSTASIAVVSHSDTGVAHQRRESASRDITAGSHAHPTEHSSLAPQQVQKLEGRKVAADHDQGRSVTQKSVPGGTPVKAEDGSDLTVSEADSGPQFLCNRCHWEKQKEQTATPVPRALTPPVAATQIDSQAPPLVLTEQTDYKRLSPQAPSPWSSAAVPNTLPVSSMTHNPHISPIPQAPQMAPTSHPPANPPPHDTRHPSRGPQEPPYHGPDSVSSAAPVMVPPPPSAPMYAPSHAPPSHAPPPHAPPPHAPPLHYKLPPYSPYGAADGRERAPPYPRQYPVPPPAVNGYPPQQREEPASFQYRRDRDTGQLYQVPYVPRGQTPSSAASSSLRSPPPISRLMSPHTRSPQIPHSLLPPGPHHMTPPSRHVRPSPPPPPSLSGPESGPHGPPEADSNPFVTAFGSQSSPRLGYAGTSIYESPRSHLGRPETPDHARGGRWPSEARPLANGASESPNLRNLLH